VEQVLAFVEQQNSEPWRNLTTGELYLDGDGKEQPHPHFFQFWLWGLPEGSWSLPGHLPRTWWDTFASLHGAVIHRCGDCLCATGNAVIPAACPVCGSSRLQHKKLSGPPWDPPRIFTPLPRGPNVAGGANGRG